MIEFLICTDDFGEEFRSSSLAKTYLEWRRLVQDDKEHHIKREYTFYKCEPGEGNIEWRTEVKIYRRGTRVFYRAI